MGFALHEDGLAAHASIPTQTNGLCALGLFQSSHVQLPSVRVIEVNGCDG